MLTLPIKKKWFDMILSGEKKEEYRNLSEYYTTRFHKLFNSIDGKMAVNKKQLIAFRNGYASSSPYFVALCSCREDFGNPEWGAEPDEKYFVLTIHKIINPDVLNDLQLK